MFFFNGIPLAHAYPSDRPQQRPRDDMALDLGRAFPDALDPARRAKCVPSGRSSISPMPPMDLDRLVGHEGQHFGRLQLGHGHVLVGGRALIGISSRPRTPSGRPPSISVAMSASLNETPWNLPICWPNCSRCAA